MIKMALGMEVGLGPSHIVLDGDPALLPQKRADPQFSVHFYCRQTAGCIKMPLGMEVGLSPGDFMFDGDPATPRTEGTPTTSQFLAHVYCGQTAVWMKTLLGTEVDLVLLDEVPALRERGTTAPIFSAHLYRGHGRPRPSQLLLSSCCISCTVFEIPGTCISSNDSEHIPFAS